MNSFVSVILSFLIFVFINHAAKANPLSGIVDLLESPTQIMSQNLTCKPLDIYQECAKELCGNYKDSERSEPVTPFKLTPQDRKDLESLISKTFEKKRKSLDRIAKSLNEGASFTDYTSWTQSDWEREAYRSFSRYIKPKIDLDKSIKERVSYELPSNADPGLRSWLTRYAQATNTTPNLISLKALSLNEAKKEVQKEFEALKKDPEKFNLYLNTSSEYRPNLENINEMDEKGLIIASQYILNLGAKSFQTVSLCDDSKCREAVRKIDSELQKSNIEAMKEDLNNFSYQELAVSKCKNLVSVDEEYVKLTVKFENETYSKIKKLFLKNGSSFICPSLMKEFQDYINKIVPNFSLSDKFITWPSIKVKLENNLNEKQDLQNAFQEMSNKGITSDLDNICRNNSSFTPDQFSSDDDGKLNFISIKDPTTKIDLYISPRTVFNNLERTVYHELGHALSYFMLNQPANSTCRLEYEKQRNCISLRRLVADRNQKLFASFASDSTYSEEDMADFIASKIKPSTHFNAECSVINLFKEGDEYKVLKPVDYKEPLLPGRGLHSPPLLRMLWSRIDQGASIPDACQKLMMQELPDYKWEKCE